MRHGTIRRLIGGFLSALLLVWAGRAYSQTVRAIMHAEVMHLDPHWTTAGRS